MDGGFDVRSRPSAIGVIRRLWRAPLLALAMLSMVWGVWMGLLRLGWVLPLPWPDQLILHGPLMVGGFLGTLIGLERAVGIARRWAYAAPLLTAAGSVLLVFGPPGPLGPLFITVGSAIVVAVFGVVLWRDASLFASTMTLGAAAWVVGNARWLAGAAIYRVVFWWVAFLVLTIAGERLELNRLLRPSYGTRLAFVMAIGCLIAGVGIAGGWPENGVRLAGAGLVALSIWLGSFDIARRTVRQGGVTRFIAVCLLSGYLWLGVGGVIAMAGGASTPGAIYDAVLHATFLGFVVAMIFGHAPIVFPAILGRALPFRPRFYVHVAILHASVALRLTGDIVEDLARYRAWGGLLNAIALLVFVGNSAWSIVTSDVPRSLSR
jgi:hypothetical protein